MNHETLHIIALTDGGILLYQEAILPVDLATRSLVDVWDHVRTAWAGTPPPNPRGEP